jgi:hypothetical protein
VTGRAKRVNGRRLDPSVGREPPLYTMRRCRGKYSDERIGPTHASERGDVTWCGVDTDESWWIETNRRGDGEVTCRKCAAVVSPPDDGESAMTSNA